MLKVSPIINDNTNFKKNEKTNKEVETPVKCVKKEGTIGKKCGVGIASFLIPGLGQAINGQWGKGAGFFGGKIVLTIATIAHSLKTMGKGSSPSKSSKLIPLLAGLGLSAWASFDAVKNAKSIIEEEE